MNGKQEKRPPVTPENPSLLGNLNAFLAKKEGILLIVNLALTLLFGLLLFDTRLSFATDDATYIQNAIAWNERGTYPHFQGALYPFFLALIIKVWGVKVLLLKSFSLLFLLGHNYFLYRALRGRVPALLMWGALFVSAVNAYILAYGSSTFSEAFYLCLQSLALWSLFSLIDKLDEKGLPAGRVWAAWALFGFAFFALSITKNVSMFAIVAVAGYFLLRRQWMYAGLAVAAFLVFKAPYEMWVKASFAPPGENQREMLMRKDYYDASKGEEDFDGFTDRLFTNYGQYISTHTFKMLGLRGKGVPTLWTYDKMKEMQEDMKMESSVFLGLVFLALAGFAVYAAFKDNKYILYLILHTGALLGVTFLALQSFWNQDRLVVIFLPLLFLIMVYALYSFAQNPKYRGLQLVVPAFIILCIMLQTFTTLKATGDNKKQFKAFQKGDDLGGYPEDVRNFLTLSQWAANNLQDSMRIVSGRPVESSVLAGKLRFARLQRNLPQSLDSIYADFRQKNIGYFITDSRSGVGQLAGQLYQADPSRIEVLKQEGEVEPSALLKVKYK